MYRYIKASSLGIDDEAHIVMRYNGEEIADTEKEIERSSGTNEYLSTGTLYQSIIPLKIEGAVEVSYTPVKLRRAARKVEIE